MVICTYLEDCRVESFKITDADVLEYKKRCEKLTGKKFHIEEREVELRRWFRKPKVQKYYSLYFGPIGGNGIEYQQFNFHMDHDWSINTAVPKSCIMNYLLGVLFWENKVPSGSEPSGEVGK